MILGDLVEALLSGRKIIRNSLAVDGPQKTWFRYQRDHNGKGFFEGQNGIITYPNLTDFRYLIERPEEFDVVE